MIRIPQHIEELQSYKPGKAVQDVFAGMGLERTAILSSNENNLGPSPKAMQAVQQAMLKAHLYPEPASSALRNKLAERLGQQPENIIIGNGSDGILSNIFKAFFEEGDELISSEGSFVAVNVMTRMNNIAYPKAPLTSGYAFDLDAIYSLLTSNTKAVYLCNPNNPTGAMIGEQALREFVEKIPENVLVIVDEAYSEFSRALADDFPDSMQYGLPNLITLRTFSKAYGLAGLRLGYAVAHPRLIGALMKVKLTFDPSSVAQAAGLAALEDEEFLQKTIAVNQQGISYYYRHFDRLGLHYVPSFGNFVMVDFGSPERATFVFEQLMKRGVMVRPLHFFELPQCLRISAGLPHECELLVEKMEEVLQLPQMQVARQA